MRTGSDPSVAVAAALETAITIQEADSSSGSSSSSPTILTPQPTTSRMLRASPAAEYPVRSVSPDLELVPDRMADRVAGSAAAPFARRLTPTPEQQSLKKAEMKQLGSEESWKAEIEQIESIPKDGGMHSYCQPPRVDAMGA